MSGDEPNAGWRGRLRGWAQKREHEARQWAEKAEEKMQAWSQTPAVEAGLRAAEDARAWSRRVADSAALQQVHAETAKAAEWIRTTDAWRQLEEAAQRAADGGRQLARGAGERLEHIQRDVETLLQALEKAGTHYADRRTVLSAAAEAFETVGPHLDLLADGAAVGSLHEAGAGVASIRGTELFFVPADGPVRAQIRVNRIVGQSARLAVGGQVGAYVAAFYGPRDRMVRPLHRRGADLGLLLASLGFFRAHTDPGLERVGGWLFELAAGAALGIPILSDLSAFELEEVNLAAYSLSPAEAEPLESALAQAPDRAARRKVARLLGRDPQSKPG